MKYITVLLFILVTSIAGAQVKFVTKVNKKSLGIDQHIRVDFFINTDMELTSFWPPEFKNFNIVAGPTKRADATYVDEGQSLELICSYIISPKSVGNFVIDAARMELKGKRYKTVPIHIEVSKAVNSTSVPSAPNENIYLVTEVSRNSITLKDSLIVSHRIYVTPAIKVIDWKLVDQPVYTNCSISANKIRDLKVENVIYKESKHSSLIWQKVILKPKGKGVISIAPVEIAFQMKFLSGKRDVYGVPTYETKLVQLKSNEVIIAIR
ncbi:hypothetical protein Celal_0268 [Cellulophaga algicola DSM 14237]|uniref:Uncharacterized protein n=1 Tax=Cellulophaga algicola (strain DSM 14237 / IC166 / ACAM 630) TaxID=688270 RepID=E6X8M7_CELAD|nr:BatD family protein [Cellulophaga algicola]ADV47614.1 hypothetical protein Celal_0268 [Cellulophaga algicola DSM 14237]